MNIEINGGQGSDLFSPSGALSVITFESSENVTVLVRFPATLRCRAFITDNIHIPIIRWFRVQGTTLTAADP